MSNHPFLDFATNLNFGSHAYALVGRTILYGWCINIDVVRILGFSDEIERMLFVPPLPSCFRNCRAVLGGANHEVLCFVWVPRHLRSFSTRRWATLIDDAKVRSGAWIVDARGANDKHLHHNCLSFTKDISMYLMHISRDGAPFVQFKAKGTGLIPVL